jgi:hypothetical protein
VQKFRPGDAAAKTTAFYEKHGPASMLRNKDWIFFGLALAIGGGSARLGPSSKNAHVIETIPIQVAPAISWR